MNDRGRRDRTAEHSRDRRPDRQAGEPAAGGVAAGHEGGAVRRDGRPGAVHAGGAEIPTAALVVTPFWTMRMLARNSPSPPHQFDQT
jgi:hypothetical protein